ncbi:MAG: hypothetical protein HY735_36935 [Verrucomicrobia bacterium]|nr:hypothetical protein [Verrucomicrobiota bacterium]
MNFSRTQQRTKVVSLWANIGFREFYELDGHWEGVQPPAHFRPRFSYLPYVLAQAGTTTKATAGLDVRAALTPSLTGVFTVNPDFSTVERAVEGIDFSYSERFVPDRRPFFLEGEKFYTERTLLGSFFHSPRIEDFDTGLNFYGKVAPKTSLGVLDAYSLDGRNDFVLRARQEFTETDSADLSVIGRDESDGNNYVFVAHPTLRRGPWFFTTHWAPSLADGEVAGDALNVDFSYRGKRFWLGDTYHYIRPDFRDDNGFIPFTDFQGHFSWLRYQNEWREGAVRRLIWLALFNTEDRFDGSRFRRQPSLLLNLETRGDYGIGLRWEGGEFEQFQDNVFGLSLRAKVSDKFHNYGVGLQFGRQKGEELIFVTPSISWRFGERFSLGAASSILSHIESRQQHILTVNYDLTKAKSIGGRVVVQNDHTSAFLSFRRSGYSGMDYYVIVGDPNPAKKFTAELFVKVVKPF